MLSREACLTNVISSFDDFKRLFEISSVTINQFLQKSFILTEMSSSITNIHMNAENKVLIVGGKSS